MGLAHSGARSRVGLFTYVTAVAGVGALLGLVAAKRSSAPHNISIALTLVVFVVTLLASAFPVHIELGKDAHTFAFTELPIIVAALTMSVSQGFTILVAAATVARIIIQRTPILKCVFNGSTLAVEMALVSLCVTTIAPDRNVMETRTWVGVLVGAALGNVASGILVGGAIRLSGGKVNAGELLRNTYIGVAGAAIIASVALVGLILTEANPLSLIFSILLIAGVVLFHRRHVTLTERYRAVLKMERFTRALTPANESSETIISALLANAAELMNTESSALVLANRDGEVLLARTSASQSGAGEFVYPTPTDWVWVRAISENRSFMLDHHAHRDESSAANYLDRMGVKDLIVAPLELDDNTVGLIIGHNRRNDVVRVSTADLDLMSTMAHHASVNLKCSRLIEQLGLEVADRHYEATHDSLTGLHNRAAFNSISDTHFRSFEDYDRSAMMLVDLNQFKKVNDTMGHHAGDEVLVQISERLLDTLPEGATVARLGGDEFAVLLPTIDSPDEALQIAMRFREAVRIPVTVESITFTLDAAIGVSLAPLDGTDRHNLLKRADIAMYAAKDRPNNPIALYESSQQRWTAREIGLLDDLRRTLETCSLNPDAIPDSTRGLSLAYQPKTSLVDGKVFGVEALCRWNHPELGPIRPDEFIGLAEQGGLIDHITDFVVRTALRQGKAWLDEGLRVDVAINIPAKSLSDPTLAARMAAMAQQFDVPANTLTLEVTESQLVEDARSSREVMATLRAYGFRVSIDDFGTGYSSLAYLHQLPVDELKIDRAFVGDVATNESSRQIVHIIVELAKTFGLKTVAEGIETQEVHDVLCALGVELGQGFLMARPAPAHELGDYLRRGFLGARRSAALASTAN